MSIVRAPGRNHDGTIGVRGWRGLCKCLWLSPVGTYHTSRKALARHRKTCDHYKNAT